MALLAWLVFPLLAGVICVGIGLLAERLAGARLEPALLAPLGYAAAIAVLVPVFATGAGATPALVLLIALASGGFAVAARGGFASRLRPGAGALAAAIVYAIFIAPIALSGSVTFLGYNLLNDTAIHLALVDWIGDHGSRFIQQAPSSYGATINDYVRSRYPLGSHELLAALRPLVGLDAARVYQPFLALSAAVTAPALFALLRRSLNVRIGVAGAVIACCGQLVFSFALQGGIKELSFIACLAAAATLAAAGELALMAIAAAALYAIYGVYALPWIAPLALVAVWIVRPSLRRALVAVGVFVVAVAVEVPDSIKYWRHGHDVITSGAELGPLAGPLKPLQAAGVWLTGDYRFMPQHSWITSALAIAIVALAVYGVVRAVQGERSLLLFVVPPVVAWAITAPASSPYIDAKLLTIMSPAVLVAAAYGVTRIRIPRAALAVAAVLALAVVVSDALAYRMAIVAPQARLDELARIDKQLAGRGPVLVNEYEEYTKHFMRRSRGSDPYEGWTAARAQLRDPQLPVAAHAYDLDRLRTSFVERWPYIVLRRSPTQGTPPPNFRRVSSGRWYAVWQRTSRARARPRCKPPRVIPIANAQPLPAGWHRSGNQLVTNKGGRIAMRFAADGSGRVWLAGSTFRKLRVLIDGREVGTVRQLNGPNQWIDVGPADLTAGRHTVELVRPTRSLRPGDAQSDHIGPLAITAAPCG